MKIKLSNEEFSHLWGFIMAMLDNHKEMVIQDIEVINILAKVKRQVPWLRNIEQLKNGE